MLLLLACLEFFPKQGTVFVTDAREQPRVAFGGGNMEKASKHG